MADDNKRQYRRPVKNKTVSGKATGDRAAAKPEHNEAHLRPTPLPEALASQEGFRAWLNTLPPPPASFSIGQDINWKAPWVEVKLRVELPFWLMMKNATTSVEVGGHEFPITIRGETFELHIGGISDAKASVLHVGPIRRNEDLSPGIRSLLRKRPKPNVLWRKCKTMVEITSRCNEDVWNKLGGGTRPRPSITRYLQSLCGAHIPVLNKLIQAYRLATYDYFAFEVAPWDVPYWYVERDENSALCILVPYREWDQRPVELVAGGRQFLQYIEASQLSEQMSEIPSPGELELMDAMNLMERGNYSDAIRRVTTAIEVVVEATTAKLVEQHEGPQASGKFIKNTRTNFSLRVKKYGALSGRPLRDELMKVLMNTRNLRHQIVHAGYRISPGERGNAQKCIDTGRWIFNWLENNEERRKIRETRLASRSFGRDLLYNIFRPEITPDGVLLSSVEDQLAKRSAE
jgi:hypothetical protein